MAGKPVTASSSLLNDVPSEDCDVWQRLAAAGMILLGHLHTHEFAAGGTTDQVGNPWDLARTAGGSSGGSAAALAARMVPAATGSDTAGSLRIPSACCGTSTIKPTRGLVSTRGVVPLSWSLDHAGPMARSVADCRALLSAMAVPDERATASTFDGARIAVSPRLTSVALDDDVAAGFERAVEACRQLGATIIELPAPDCGFDVADAFRDVMTTDMLAYHRRFDGHRERYRPALREWLEVGEERAVSGERYASLQAGRRAMTAAWSDWLGEHRITAVIEPTIPVVAPPTGRRLRARWHRLRADLAHPLLELDRFPGRRPAGRCGTRQQTSGERVADRRRRHRPATARSRHPTPGRTRRSRLAMMTPRRFAAAPGRRAHGIPVATDVHDR